MSDGNGNTDYLEGDQWHQPQRASIRQHDTWNDPTGDRAAARVDQERGIEELRRSA